MSVTVVIKLGGTSLATARRVERAARRVRAHVRRGRRVAVVVSAAGRSTDRILSDAGRLCVSGAPGVRAPFDTASARLREVDRALVTGEDRSAAILAVTLWQLGVPARSLRGGEAGVRADGGFGEGRIVRVEAERLHRLLDGGVVPVVSGFQGERADGETVTLGRGGSDTSAVAIAAALGATCHIVTDVDAVYDRDPNIDPEAQPFTVLDHASLVALVERGGRVVHPFAARLAAARHVPLRIYHYRARLGGAGTRIGTSVPVAAAPAASTTVEVAAHLGGAA